MELIFRLLVGGLVVSFFAVIGDVLKPKSFAGLFGATLSVASATLGLTIVADGKAYAALEARSMIAGACAFFVYAYCCMRVMAKHKVRGHAGDGCGPRAVACLCARRMDRFFEVAPDEDQFRHFGSEANTMVRICIALRRHLNRFLSV